MNMQNENYTQTPVFLTDEEINLLKAISVRGGIRGQKILKDFIWMNTTQHPYKKGDLVVFNDSHRSISGHRLMNMNGRIVGFRYWSMSRQIAANIEFTLIIEDDKGNVETQKDDSVILLDEIVKIGSTDQNYIYKTSDVCDQIEL